MRNDDLVPEDGIFHAQASIVEYLTPEGEFGFVCSYSGDVPLSQMLGLIELLSRNVDEYYEAD